MKLSEIINECLEDNEDYKKLSKPQKLASKTLIKATMGREDPEIGEDEVEPIKQLLKDTIAGVPLDDSSPPEAA